MNQATLSAWTIPSSDVCLRGSYFVPDKAEAVKPSEPITYDCHNCENNKGIVGAKVKCMCRLKDIPLNSCSSWSDDKDLEEMLKFAPPKDFVPWKYQVDR